MKCSGRNLCAFFALIPATMLWLPIVSAQKGGLPAGVKVIRGMDYAGTGNTRHQLDLYLPSAKNTPLVVWIHGGGWRNGSKANCRLRWMAGEGFAVASINYRLSGEAKFPAQMHDCKAAIRWLRANAEKYGYNAKRIGIAGSSAGGHLVALLGTSGGAEELEGKVGKHLKQSSGVQAVIDLFGPTDFLQMDEHRIPGSRLVHNSPKSPEALLIGGPIQENKAKVAKANPITYVDKSDPPILILHGDKDLLVPVHQSIIFEKALKRAGAPVELHILKGAGHGGKQFNAPEVQRMMRTFFEKHLK